VLIKELGEGHEVTLPEADEDFLGLDLEWIVFVVKATFVFILYAELEVEFVVGVFEEVVEDDVLVLLYDFVFAADEGGKEAEVLGGERTLRVLLSLFEEIANEVLDFALVNGGLDGDGIVVKDVNETLLGVGLIDVVGVLEEEVDPPGNVDPVFLEISGYVLKQDVGVLEDLGDLEADGPILRGFAVELYELEGVVEVVDDLDQDLYDTCLHEDALHGAVGGVGKGGDVVEVGAVDLAGQHLLDLHDIDQLVLLETREELRVVLALVLLLLQLQQSR
jgi:hypothetical protein